jgi:hypothetical protein
MCNMCVHFFDIIIRESTFENRQFLSNKDIVYIYILFSYHMMGMKKFAVMTYAHL